MKLGLAHWIGAALIGASAAPGAAEPPPVAPPQPATITLQPSVLQTDADRPKWGAGASGEALVRGGLYDRPYLLNVADMVAIGGYLEFMGNYFRDSGVDEFGFEVRRFNIFLSSSIARFIRLTSEIEFEHGVEEIALETAALDILFHHTINLRGGILLAPIGRFNIAHDSPRYDIIDRPLVSTLIIPATYSDVGFGLFGAFYPGRGHQLTYEVYVVNGIGAGILQPNATAIAEGKAEFFEEDDNNVPAVVGRIAYVAPIGLEVGASGYGGIYNEFKEEGIRVGEKRWLSIAAFDWEFDSEAVTVRGELAYAYIQRPDGSPDTVANEQFGIYGEGVWRFWRGALWRFDRASVAGVVRVDYVDLNLGDFDATEQSVGSEIARLSVGVSFRPAPATSIRVTYQHNWQADAFGTDSRRGGLRFGMATYF